MRKIILLAALASVTVPAMPAFADPPRWAPAHGRRAQDMYDNRGYYREPHALRRNDRVWRGNDGQYHCKRDNGTTGLVIGAAAGGLLGNQIAGRGDKTLGTIIGAVGGGLLGRSVDRGDLKCR